MDSNGISKYRRLLPQLIEKSEIYEITLDLPWLGAIPEVGESKYAGKHA